MNHSLIDVASDGAKSKCGIGMVNSSTKGFDLIDLALCTRITCDNCPYSRTNQGKSKGITSRLRLLMID